MKILLIIILFLSLISANSCQHEGTNTNFQNEQKSINDVLDKFPFIDKKLEKIKKVEFDSLAITLYRNIEKVDYDEILVFQKGNKFYAIPFFSNMYYDFWNFKNENGKNRFSPTNTTFEKEFEKSASYLCLNADEKRQTFVQLITSILNTEDMLEKKPQMFEDFVLFSRRKSKYKDEKANDCLKKTKALYKQIIDDKSKDIRSTYILDRENGRVYKLFNESKNSNEYILRIETYRVDCYTTFYEM